MFGRSGFSSLGRGFAGTPGCGGSGNVTGAVVICGRGVLWFGLELGGAWWKVPTLVNRHVGELRFAAALRAQLRFAARRRWLRRESSARGGAPGFIRGRPGDGPRAFPRPRPWHRRVSSPKSPVPDGAIVFSIRSPFVVKILELVNGVVGRPPRRLRPLAPITVCVKRNAGFCASPARGGAMARTGLDQDHQRDGGPPPRSKWEICWAHAIVRNVKIVGLQVVNHVATAHRVR